MPAAPSGALAASQSLVAACDCALHLIMSVRVGADDQPFDEEPLRGVPSKDDDDDHSAAAGSSASRFEVLLYALRSYAPLPLARVHLYI